HVYLVKSGRSRRQARKGDRSWQATNRNCDQSGGLAQLRERRRFACGNGWIYRAQADAVHHQRVSCNGGRRGIRQDLVASGIGLIDVSLSLSIGRSGQDGG